MICIIKAVVRSMCTYQNLLMTTPLGLKIKYYLEGQKYSLGWKLTLGD
jgi:hypothetical protein